MTTSAFYSAVTERPDGGEFRANAATGGPWDPELQHGGPPMALLVHAAERWAFAETGRTDLIAMRISAEFVGPVPVGRVEVTARTVRAATSAVLVACTLEAAGRSCLQARIWLVRDADTTEVAAASVDVVDPVGLPGLGTSFPYGDNLEWLAVAGSLTTPGPGCVWARPRIALIDGASYTGLQRAALVGDSASGIGSELPWDTWSFQNIDLDVHLARPLRGEWVQLDARTQLGTNGAGLALSTVSDLYGPVGSTAATLVLARR